MFRMSEQNNFRRKNNRLPFKKLYQEGSYYFITICVQDKKCIFGNIVEEKFISPELKSVENRLLPLGKIIEKEWLSLSNFFENIVLDEFVIMPNHFHAIIGFNGVPISKFTGKESDLGKIVKYFKAKSTILIKDFVAANFNSPLSKSQNSNQDIDLIYGQTSLSATLQLLQMHNTIWQKSFYDHIIRDESDLNRIREYILNNPLNWKLDEMNPSNKNKLI